MLSSPQEMFLDVPSPVLMSLSALLLERRETLSVAESCTGGRLAAMATAVAGSSQWFAGGIISYSVSAKESLLGIPSSLILEKGVVSSEVAIAMAEGAASELSSNLAIATTGIAGPSGGTVENPVGTIWMAIYYHGASHTQKLSLQGKRTSILAETACQAYRFAWQCLVATRSNPPMQNNPHNIFLDLR